MTVQIVTRWREPLCLGESPEIFVEHGIFYFVQRTFLPLLCLNGMSKSYCLQIVANW